MKTLSLFMCFLLMLPTVALANNTTVIKLDPSGDDEYNLEFENRQAAVYKVPYMSNEGRTFKFGDDNDDLVFIEGSFAESHNSTTIASNTGIHNATFNIGIQDYFVLSDIQDPSGYDENAITHVVRYNSIDTSDRTLSFDDLATGSKEFTYEVINPSNAATIGRADLIFGGNTYVAYVANVTQAGNDNPLAVDMDADGNIHRAEIRVTTKSGGIIDLGNASASDGGTYTYQDNGARTQTWSNTGNVITNPTSDFALLTKQGLIKKNKLKQNEVVTAIVETRPNNEIGINRVVGSRFTLPGKKNPFRTKYGVCFDLFDPPGSDDAETLTITYSLEKGKKSKCRSQFVSNVEYETKTFIEKSILPLHK